MKTIAFLSIIILLTSCKSNRNETLLPSLDKQSLYPTLFNAEVKDDWCYWKPSPADGDSCNVSYTGVCNTRLDTILYFTEGTTKKAVIIFGTYMFDEHGMDQSHVAAPVVSIAVTQKQENGYWEVVKFVKNFGQHGSWGQQPDYGITQFGKHFFLYEDWGYTNQGCTEHWKILWHLPSLVESLRIDGIDDSGLREDPRQVSQFEESIIDASSGKETKVVVKKTGMIYEEGKGQVSIDESREYLLNDSNVFIKIHQQQPE